MSRGIPGIGDELVLTVSFEATRTERAADASRSRSRDGVVMSNLSPRRPCHAGRPSSAMTSSTMMPSPLRQCARCARVARASPPRASRRPSARRAGPRRHRYVFRRVRARSLSLHGGSQEPRSRRMDQGAGRLHAQDARSHSRARGAAEADHRARRRGAGARLRRAVQQRRLLLPEAAVQPEHPEALRPRRPQRQGAVAGRPRSDRRRKPASTTRSTTSRRRSTTATSPTAYRLAAPKRACCM